VLSKDFHVSSYYEVGSYTSGIGEYVENGIERGLEPPSTSKIISGDRAALQGFFALLIGITIIAMLLVSSSLTSRSSDHPSYFILVFGVLLSLFGVLLLIRRIRAVSAIFVNGVEVKARITKWDTVETKSYSGFEAKLTYEMGGHIHQASASIPNRADALDSLKAGDNLSLVVDQENPKRFLVLEAYEPNDVLMGHLKKDCEVCGKGLLLRDMEGHMKAMHPETQEHVKPLLRTVRALILVAIATSLYSIIRWGNSWQSALVVGLSIVFVLVLAWITMTQEEKRLSRARQAWQASHRGHGEARHDDS
jgi:hypothetical protein